MLTTNLDVCDGLVNGSLGTVVGFEYNKEGRIQYIMVSFDDKEDGKRRRTNCDRVVAKYPGLNATPIELMEINFSQSRLPETCNGLRYAQQNSVPRSADHCEATKLKARASNGEDKALGCSYD